MSMYFVGIDISKYKHDCCIISAADQQIVSKFTVMRRIIVPTYGNFTAD